jgi:hypothetical protein
MFVSFRTDVPHARAPVQGPAATIHCRQLGDDFPKLVALP